MEPLTLRAEVDRALLGLRARTALQIAVCGATVLWAMAVTQPLPGGVVVTPPAAFAIAVALGREQAVRRSWALATHPAEQLRFLRRFVDELLARRRRLRLAGPLWCAGVWGGLRYVDFGGVEAMRTGLEVIGAAMLAISAYAFASVPRLAALRARLEPAV